MQGLVNLFGIKSPGLTSSLPLADEVVAATAGSGSSYRETNATA